MNNRPADVQILQGDVRAVLPTLASESVHCVVSSPPFFGLRDYGTASWEGGDVDCQHNVQRWEGQKQTQGAQSGHAATTDRLARNECSCGAIRVDHQIGLEATPAEYIETIVSVFREVRRILRPEGTAWLNMGDGFANDAKWGGATGGKHAQGLHGSPVGRLRTTTSLKPKDLVMMPFRLALALQADGWWVRSDIVWAKPNPMPESVQDRPTRSHEYIFLLTKSEHYFYDAAAIREPVKAASITRINQPSFEDQAGGPKDYATSGENPNRSMRRTLERFRDKQRGHGRRHDGFNDRWDAMTKEEQQANGANKRDVWTVATRPYRGAHFATFPPALIEPCILAGCPRGGTVLDPFAGSGTTGEVAVKHNRNAVLVELNPEYCALIEKRLSGVQRTLPLDAGALPLEEAI